jgi:hypothetical protein
MIFYNYEKETGYTMDIAYYSFGRIVIDGQTYTADVILYPERVYSPWWRKEGHKLHPADLTDVIAAKPEVLIIGTGYSGLMSVPKETVSHLESQGIKIYIERTTRAVELFTEIQKSKKVIAAFHLTC